MPRHLIVPIGSTYGKWTVIDVAPNQGMATRSLCMCNCGVTKALRNSVLKAGKSRSCGKCAQDSQRNKTHGRTNTFEFSVWHSMKARCGNPKHVGYKYYGAKGISVTPEWKDSFERFLHDMGECPYGALGSLDRVDNSLDYRPDNCRWVLRGEQAKNRTVVPLYDGMTIPDLAKKYGLKYTTLRRRINAGWPKEQWFIQPQPNKNGEYNNA